MGKGSQCGTGGVSVWCFSVESLTVLEGKGLGHPDYTGYTSDHYKGLWTLYPEGEGDYDSGRRKNGPLKRNVRPRDG